MSFPVWNSDPSWNKITSSYFRDNIDLSGNFIIRNGKIRSPNNTIEFDDTFGFINFTNASFLGQLKNTFNSVEYDIGLQCEKTEEAVADIATLSPIVSDTAFKLTGLYWDAGLSSTVFTNNVSFPNGSISSLAISNSSFVSKSGAESIDGVKTFNSAPVMSGGSISVGSIPVNRVSGGAVNLNSAQSITSTKSYSMVQNFNSSIRLDGSLLLSNGSLNLVNSTLARVAYLADVNSAVGANLTSLQTQITNINAITAGANNTFTGNNTFNGITTTVANTLSSSILTVSTSINGTTKAIFDNILLYGNSLSENIQTAINALKTKTDTTNINLATTTTSANEAKQRTTDIEFSDVGGNQTTISNKCVLGEVVFQTDLNDITPTTFSYLQGVTGPIQTAIDSKTRIPTGTIIMSVGDSLQNSQPLIWLKCNGQEVSRTTYVNLYQYILSRYGPGDGSTTFNVPNFQACFLRGGMYFPETERVVNGVTYTPNGPLTIQQDSLEAHVHSSNLSGNYLRSGSTSNTSDAYLLGTTRPNRSDFPGFTGGVSSSHRTSTETRGLNYSIFYYIKT